MIGWTISFKVASLALGQSDDCPSASEGTLKDTNKIYSNHTTTEYNKHVLFCFVLFSFGCINNPSKYMWHDYPYSSELLHWHWGNHMIAPVPVKQPWRTQVNTSCESNRHCNITSKNKVKSPWSIWLQLTVTKSWQDTMNHVYKVWDVLNSGCKIAQLPQKIVKWQRCRVSPFG